MGSSGLATSDVIRSMMREGFAHGEIYDVLTGIGLRGEQVQLLLDRIASEFHEAKLEPRTSRLGAEVEKLFTEVFEGLQHELAARMDKLSRELDLFKLELEKLGKRIVELQSVIIRSHGKFYRGSRAPRSRGSAKGRRLSDG